VDVIQFLSENPGSAAWLASLLPPESAALLKASAWYKTAGEAAAPAADFSPPESANKLPAVFQLAGLTFNRNEGVLVCSSQIPVSVFMRFIEEKPEWKAEQRDRLVEAGLAGSAYLAEVSAPGDAITRISWFAAQAFCEWLTAQLPASMRGYKVSLPHEALWQQASTSFNESSLWEWCADPYIPLPFIKASDEKAALVGSPERVIRSRISPNARAAGKTEGRASLPPDFCPPVVTFRPVIEPGQKQ
jgi:hypothetical protein